MGRSVDTPQRWLAGTLLVTLAVTFLPMQWRLNWSREISQVVRVPLRPFTHAGNILAGLLRQPATGYETIPPEVRPLVMELQQQLDETLQQMYREREKATNFEHQLDLVQGFRDPTGQTMRRAMVADVIRRNGGHPEGGVEVRMRRRMPGTLLPGAVAIHQKVHLLGRVALAADPASEDLRATCIVLPITDPSTGYLNVRLEGPGYTLRPFRLQVIPQADGMFAGELDRQYVIEEGDRVLLDDALWPAAAQMLTIGTVVQVEEKREEPLLNRIVVRPLFQLHRLSWMTLVCDEVGVIAEGGGP